MNTTAPPWRSAGVPPHSMNGKPLLQSPISETRQTATDLCQGMSAYTSVNARRSFAPPPPPEPVPYPTPSPTMSTQPSPVTPNSPNGGKRIDWPPAVRAYVSRCFGGEHAVDGISQEEMQTKLKQIITDAANSNNLLRIDWETLPLPQQMIQSEKKRANTATTATWKDVSSQPYPAEALTSLNGNQSRKRKSSELVTPETDADSQPPWRKTNYRNVFEDRITYPSPVNKRQRTDHGGKNTSKLKTGLEHRKKRFENGRSGFQSPQNGNSSRDDSPLPDVDHGPVVGRSQVLEKNYFRLTSAPNPDTVRPLPILQKTLELLKKKWRKENNYVYICDQFKSLRQDLTVQHIKNEFTVNVYEIHARIALEKGDLGEYNQCQTQLRALYAQKLGGHPTEFKAYRILYFIHTCNRTDMNDVLADLTPTDKLEPAVKHALDVRSALALGNYHRFFQLYLETPNMGAYLMDMFVERERLAALASICKS